MAAKIAAREPGIQEEKRPQWDQPRCRLRGQALVRFIFRMKVLVVDELGQHVDHCRGGVGFWAVPCCAPGLALTLVCVFKRIMEPLRAACAEASDHVGGAETQHRYETGMIR